MSFAITKAFQFAYTDCSRATESCYIIDVVIRSEKEMCLHLSVNN